MSNMRLLASSYYTEDMLMLPKAWGYRIFHIGRTRLTKENSGYGDLIGIT